jgi:hypothetical protein
MNKASNSQLKILIISFSHPEKKHDKKISEDLYLSYLFSELFGNFLKWTKS